MLIRNKFSRTKSPITRFTPDFIASNVQLIDFAKLKKLGIKACFIDLDNTVVEHAAYEVSDDIKTALQNSGLNIYIATNRPKSRDLKDLKDLLGAQGVIHPHGLAGKPFKRYFINGLRDMGLSRHETVMIGDRYVQDILGSNRAGMYSLLVYKLGKPIGIIDWVFSALEQTITKRISKNYS